MRTFDTVIGHADAIAGLKASRAAGRISNGYLFCGLPGVGRRTVMQAFASALLCQSKDHAPCGVCESCRFSDGAHPDLVLLDPEAELIPVDAMREFCSQIAIRPSIAPRRVGCIPEANRMNDMAANCFLKTLEEPPGAGVMLMSAISTDLLLRTIVSRCQVIRLGRHAEEIIAGELARRGVEPARAAALAAVSDGSLGRALAASDSAVDAEWQALREQLMALKPPKAFAFAEWLMERAQEAGRDVASVRRRAAELSNLALLFYRLEMRRAPSTRGLLRRMEAVETALRQLAANVKVELVLRALSLTLAYGGRP